MKQWELLVCISTDLSWNLWENISVIFTTFESSSVRTYFKDNLHITGNNIAISWFEIHQSFKWIPTDACGLILGTDFFQCLLQFDFRSSHVKQRFDSRLSLNTFLINPYLILQIAFVFPAGVSLCWNHFLLLFSTGDLIYSFMMWFLLLAFQLLAYCFSLSLLAYFIVPWH